MPRTILIAEDEPYLRMMASEFLTDAGFEVVHSANSAEALKVLSSRHDIDLLFTDVHMPGVMDGLALARQVRHDWPTIAIMVASGKATPNEGDLPKDVRFMGKPYNFSKLVEDVRNVLKC